MKTISQWFISGSASNSVYLTGASAVRSGGPTGQKYLSFGDLSIDPTNNSLWFAYARQSTHNSVADGDIVVIKSTDGGTTWTNASGGAGETLIRAANGTNIFTNAGIICLASGRNIIYYTKLINLNGTKIYSKYSDDNFTTLSSATSTDANVITTDYDSFGTGYCDSASGAIQAVNGDIYKPVYGQYSATGYEGALYKSTDNGVSYSRVSTIWAIADNLQEPSIAFLKNGNIICLCRDDVNNKQCVIIGNSTGTSWGSISKPFTSDSKAGVCVHPTSGQVFMIGRGDSGTGHGYGLHAWSNDNGVNWTVNTSSIASRVLDYAYGGCVWHSPSSKYKAVFCAVSYDIFGDTSGGGHLYTGPNLILSMDFTPSTSPLTGPTVYDPQYQSMLDFAQANGETLPNTAQKTLDNTFVAALRSASLLSKIDMVQLPGHADATLEAFCKRDLMAPWYTVTTTASPTYATDGYRFNGSTQYVTLSRRTDQFTNYKLNNCSIMYYTPTNALGPAFGRNFGYNGMFLITRGSDGNLYWRMHDSTNTIIANSNGSGRYLLQRISSANRTIYRNGTSLGAAAVASIGPIDSTIPMVGCLSNAGTPQNFSTNTFSLIIFADGMAGLESTYDTIVANYLTSLGI